MADNADNSARPLPAPASLAALRPEEDHPGLEVVGEFLECVRPAATNRPERHPLGIAAEHAGAGRDDIALVLLVQQTRQPTRQVVRELAGKRSAPRAMKRYRPSRSPQELGAPKLEKRKAACPGTSPFPSLEVVR